MEVESHDLVERVRARDPAALQEVVDACLPQVLRAARAAGLPEQEAEDVTQETFLVFLNGLERFEGRSSVRTWIFGILYRKISEVRRGKRKLDAMEDIDDVLEDRFDDRGNWIRPPRPVDGALFDEQVRHHLEGCLEGLPDKHRMAFVLREMEGLDTGEVCNILVITRTNLGVILHRARNTLRECLERRGFSKE